MAFALGIAALLAAPLLVRRAKRGYHAFCRSMDERINEW
jgi:hypothetical protein